MKIDKFNETIDVWLNELSSFTLNQLLIKPDKKSWSLGQLYQHIIEETNWYNEQIKVSLTDKENSKIATTENARILIDRGFFEDIMIKGDQLISDNIEQPTNIEDLKSDLEKLKANTNILWSKMNKTTSYGKSEHSGIGYLNCFEWLLYSEIHMRHHLKQKARIENYISETS